MKVNAWKNIDIETEVDVSLDDCITEMLSVADEDGMPSRKLLAIDGATKVLERISPELVADRLQANPRAIELIRSRLLKWIDAIQCNANPL